MGLSCLSIPFTGQPASVSAPATCTWQEMCGAQGLAPRLHVHREPWPEEARQAQAAPAQPGEGQEEVSRNRAGGMDGSKMLTNIPQASSFSVCK